jgi:hypothetical protein
VLGSIYPDPCAQVLGTGYSQFNSPSGIDGLAKWTDDRLDLLAVVTPTPGRGQFREFIKSAERHFRTICIWEVWNPWLESVLKRYGFTQETEVLGTGEIVNGFRWDVKDTKL